MKQSYPPEHQQFMSDLVSITCRMTPFLGVKSCKRSYKGLEVTCYIEQTGRRYRTRTRFEVVGYRTSRADVYRELRRKDLRILEESAICAQQDAEWAEREKVVDSK